MSENSLYDRDFYLWLYETAEALKAKDMERIDWANLIEEIESMGRSESRAVYSYLKQLLLHLLKLKYWDTERERNYRNWTKEIVNFRSEIEKRLDDSPSLKTKLPEIYERSYRDAIRVAEKTFDLPSDARVTLEEALEKEV